MQRLSPPCSPPPARGRPLSGSHRASSPSALRRGVWVDGAVPGSVRTLCATAGGIDAFRKGNSAAAVGDLLGSVRVPRKSAWALLGGPPLGGDGS